MADRDVKSADEVNAEIREPDEVLHENITKDTWREQLTDNRCVICGWSLRGDELSCRNCGMDYSGMKPNDV